MLEKVAIVCAFLVLSVQAQYYDLGGFGGLVGYGVQGPLAVNTRHQSVNYIPTLSRGFAQPTDVFIESRSAPIVLHYRTASSPMVIRHSHQKSPGSFRATASQDNPHVRVHTVTRPILQEVREIISPVRRVFQQVQPVQEETQTQIARQSGAITGSSSFGAFQSRGGNAGGISGTISDSF